MTGLNAFRGGQVLARVPTAGLAGFKPAFIEALRKGVATELLDGLSTLSTSNQLLTTRSVRDRREVLEAEQASLRQGRANAERQSDRQTDQAAADRWADKAAAATRDLVRVAAELDALASEEYAPRLADSFKSEVDFLVAAVAEMAEPNVLHSRERVQRHNAIVTDRRIRVLPDARVQWSACVRVPADGGVVKLGPIEWIPDEQPDLTMGLVWAAVEAAGEPAGWLTQPSPPRKALTERNVQAESGRKLYRGEKTRLAVERDLILEDLESVGVARPMANTLIAAGIPAAVEVVLAFGKQQAPAAWVPAQWRAPAWMEWMYRNYTEGLWGRNGVWAAPSWLRQAAVDLAAEEGGSITVEQLLDALEPHQVSHFELMRISRSEGEASSKKGTTGPWFFPLERTGTWPRRGQTHIPRDAFGFRTVVCDRCGEPGNVATRVLEIAGDLLCPNGHMPLARLARPDDQLAATVVVPDDYQWLRVPERVWRRRRRQSNGQHYPTIPDPQ